MSRSSQDPHAPEPTLVGSGALLIATAPDAPAPGGDACLWRSVAGKSLVAWSLLRLATALNLRRVTVVARPEREALARETLNAVLASIARPAPADISIPFTADVTLESAADGWGGAVQAGLAALGEDCPLVIAHDAALPLLTSSAIVAGMRALDYARMAAAGESVKETLKRSEGNRVLATPPRASLRRLQPPVIAWRTAFERVLASGDWRNLPGGLPALARAFARGGAARGKEALAEDALAVYDVDYLCLRVTDEDDLTMVEPLLLQRLAEA